MSSTIYELTSNRNFRKKVVWYFLVAGAILFSPLFFITMKFQRNFSDFDEYGFPTTSFASCGSERDDSSSTRMKKIYVFGYLLMMSFFVIICYLTWETKKMIRTILEVTPSQEHFVFEAKCLYQCVMLQFIALSLIISYHIMFGKLSHEYERFLLFQCYPFLEASSVISFIAASIHRGLSKKDEDVVIEGNVNNN